MKESERDKYDTPIRLKKSEIKEMDLKEGECVCQCCNGWGEQYDAERDYIIRCTHCWGDGKLDWVENVTGKKITTHTKQGPAFIGHQAGANYTTGNKNVAIGHMAPQTYHLSGSSKK
jgi:hypothetical protein